MTQTGGARATGVQRAVNARAIRWLTYLMFFMFAMTTDSVGVIIPQVIAEFGLNLTAAGALHYGSMSAIALAGLGLGFLPDRLGRKRTVLLGLGIFAAMAFLFPSAQSFTALLVVMMVSGAAIGIFKTGALALVGDISPTPGAHTSTMNLVEGFFGVGAIVGPLLVTQLADAGVSWRWLYVIAGGMCLLLIGLALGVRYPDAARHGQSAPGAQRTQGGTLGMLRNPYALGFGLAAFAYVAVECAIVVWMPTLLGGYRGPAQLLARYCVPAFFLLRALGRFAGAWLLERLEWSLALALCSAAILLCFVGTLAGGTAAGVYLLPAAGIFTSILYPTINSKGIGCFAPCDHGRVAGVILFFTCASAALGPLAMGAVSDLFGGPVYGFVLATGFALVLATGMLLNWVFKPAAARVAAMSA